MKKKKRLAKEENGNQIFIENGILVSRNSKDGRLDDLKSFKKTVVAESFENGVSKLLF